MREPKNLALFLDGTWNVVDDNTNVWRLKSLCEKDDTQAIYYSAGVGTQYGTKIIGGMFGWGLDQEIINAYEWLIDNYNHGDQIYIFGFSRGAYTARSLSGLISKCGLLQSGAALSVNQLYDRYRQGNAVRTIRELLNERQGKAPQTSFSIEELWVMKYSLPVPVKFIGVWDTVGALGIPFGNFPVISRSNYQFLDTDLKINNDFAYHALAVDEHREAFAPTLWTKTIPQNPSPGSTYPDRPLADVEQRWFVGAHANVGGGYPNDLLAQLPLQWIMGKALSHGLKFKNEVTIDGDENSAPVADSYAEFMHGIYKITPFVHPYYRPIGRSPRVRGSNTISTINETIDFSVFDRWQKDSKYRPPNLIDWATRYGVDISTLQKSVKAGQPAVSIVDAPTVNTKPAYAPMPSEPIQSTRLAV